MMRCIVFAVCVSALRTVMDGSYVVFYGLSVLFGLHMALSDMKYGNEWKWFK